MTTGKGTCRKLFAVLLAAVLCFSGIAAGFSDALFPRASAAVNVSAQWHYYTNVHQALDTRTDTGEADGEYLKFDPPAVPQTQLVDGAVYTFRGWSRTNASGSLTGHNAPVLEAAMNVGKVYAAAPNAQFYAVYSCDLTVNWHYYADGARVPGATDTRTAYLVAGGENAAATAGVLTFAFPQSADLTEPDAQFLGWRADTQFAAPEIGAVANANVPVAGGTKDYYAIYGRTLRVSYDVNSSSDGVRITTPASLPDTTCQQYISAVTDAATDLSNRSGATVELNPGHVALSRIGMAIDGFLGWNYKRAGGAPDGALTDPDLEVAQFGPNETVEVQQDTEFIAVFATRYFTVRVMDYNGFPIVLSNKVWDPETSTMVVSDQAWAYRPGVSNAIERKVRYSFNYGISDTLNVDPVLIPALDPTLIHHTDGNNHYYYKDWMISDPDGATFTGSATEGYTLTGLYADETVTAVYEGKAHHWAEDVRLAEPNCNYDGYYHRYCTVCGYGKADVPVYDTATHTVQAGTYSYNTLVTLPAYNHIPVEIDNKPATCTVSGFKDRYVCAICFLHLAPERDETGAIVNWTLLADDADWGTVIPANGHDFARVEAECTPEYNVFACSVCGLKFKTYNVSGHLLEEVPAQDATCTAPGNKQYFRCADEGCGKLFYDNKALYEITADTIAHPDPAHPDTTGPVDFAPLGHDFSENSAGSIPTCTAFGTYAGIVCARCGEPQNPNNKIPALGHRWQTVPGKYATCDTDGYSAYTVCTVCGEYQPDSEKTTEPKTGHKTGGMQITMPTCTEKGEKARVCSNFHYKWNEALNDYERDANNQLVLVPCEYKLSEELPAVGHNMQEKAKVDATCTKPGTQAYYECTRCGYLSSDADGEAPIDLPTAIPASGHDMARETVAPTCEDAGYTVTRCTRCEEATSYSDAVAALGHTGGSATCKQKAKCARCGKYYGELGEHTYMIKEKNDGDCQTISYVIYQCEVCGRTKKTSGSLGEHAYEDTLINATCTTGGVLRRVCTVCGSQVELEIGPLGHEVYQWRVENAVAYGVCLRCGETVTAKPSDVGFAAEKCPKCGFVHEGRTGIFVQDGIYCKVIAFFRSIIQMFKGMFG